MSAVSRIGCVGLFLAVSLSACSPERCDDFVARALKGTFKDAPGVASGGMRDVLVESNDERVVMTYTRADGARFRATYRVTSKTSQ